MKTCPKAVPAEKAQQTGSARSGIPSPRRRSVAAGANGRGKDVTSSAILSIPNITKQRQVPAPAASKLGKAVSRPNSSQSCDDKDDTRQRDNGVRRDSYPRDKAVNYGIPRRPVSAAETTNLTDAGRRLLLKSTAVLYPSTSPSGKPTPAAAPPVTASTKTVSRSVSTIRDRLSATSDVCTSTVQRSMSVGKGRILANQIEQPPQQTGAKNRAAAARVGLPAMVGAPYRPVPDKRDTSAGRLRPLSAASGKSDLSMASSCKSTLTTITEGPARPIAQLSASVNSAPKPPVPKLDLGGILQRRAEEQASEPVFMVAASTEDPPQPSGSSAHPSQADKRKSGSRQTSAKEEPAEHFYLYPKVNPQEKKRIEEICRIMPKKQQVAITDLFSKMVEAQAEFKNRLAQKEEEVAQKSEEAAQWRNEAEFLRAQLAMLLSARQQEDCVEDASAQPADNQL
ncbi:hypothetical protein VOLCADRAFT_120298, partial [Volvox carteri f. nagariensis]